MLLTLLEVAAGSGTESVVMGLRDDVAATLHSLDILGGMPTGRIVETRDEARRVARQTYDAAIAPQER